MNYAGHHVISAVTPTTTSSPLAVGFTWSDTSLPTPTLKICSSVSPVTFVSVGGGGTVADVDITFTDNTTGDASTTQHGFMPKLDGNQYNSMRGDGSWGHVFPRGTLVATDPFKWTQTWNNAAVNFQALIVDVLNTASGASSALQSWRIAGSEVSRINTAGAFVGPAVTVVSGDASSFFRTNSFICNPSGRITWSNGSDFNAALTRNADGVKGTDGSTGYCPIESLYDRYGSGTPEGAVTAPVGAVFHRTDGGAATSFYVKESGAGNTGWVAK